MSRIVIFTGSAGGGHTQVANTLSEELVARGHEVIVTDLLKDYSKTGKILFLDTYNFLYTKLPLVYGALYQLSDHKGTRNFSDILYSIINLDKIIDFIKKNEPDMIISVYPFGSGVLERLKRRQVITCQTVVLVTEFQAHQTHIGKGIDRYIVSNRYTKQYLMKKGVEPNVIYPTGIPINSSFGRKEMQYKNKDNFTVLLMGGSKGERFIKGSLAYIARNREMKIIVICGKNEKLRINLTKKYAKREDVEIRGFETDIQGLMSRADIIVTKPGAITITEAISQELPIVIPYAIQGHERANAKFLVRLGMAKRTYSYFQLASTIEEMIKNPEIIEDIKGNIKDTNESYCVTDSIELINQLVCSKA